MKEYYFKTARQLTKTIVFGQYMSDIFVFLMSSCASKHQLRESKLLVVVNVCAEQHSHFPSLC